MVALHIILFCSLAVLSDYAEGKHLHAYVYKKSINWWEALKFCKEKKQNLVTILNNTDHWHLEQTALRCGEKCFGKGEYLTHTWTAGTAPRHDGRFEWVTTGQPVGEDRWAPDHPRDNWGGDEHCIELFNSPQERRAWLNDVPCGAWMYVVCEASDANGL